MYEGDKGRLRTALVNNVLWIVMCYAIAILNCVVLRLKTDGKPSHLAMTWLRYCYAPLCFVSLTSFLPPFVNYSSDYTGCLLFPMVLFTLFGTLIAYAGRGSFKHRFLVQVMMNLYIGWYVFKYEYKHGKIDLINFCTTFFVTIFWDGLLSEIYIKRTAEYEILQLQSFKKIMKYEGI